MSEWYSGGLRFECQPDCHKCCLKPGIVSVEKFPDGTSEEADLAEALDLSPAAFSRRYVKSDSLNGRYITEREGESACPLWKNGCSVYKARPLQCVAYPFWPEIMVSREKWEKEGEFCPGIGKGPRHSADEIYEVIFRQSTALRFSKNKK